MDDVKLFLKVGERKYLQRLVEGHLYFTNAITVRGIEREQHIKGQGDDLEGGSIIVAQNATMVDPDTGRTIFDGIKANVRVYYGPTNGTPLFCLFSCYEKDCSQRADGSLIIDLSPDIQCMIREHFPKADAVAVITSPQQFVQDVISSIGSSCVCDNVHYFNLRGIKHGDQLVNDLEYMKYLTQDSECEVVPGVGKKYSFNAAYAYRALFCKDIDFEKEQEFRFVLNEIEIDRPKEFDVSLSEDIKLYPLSDIIPDETI